MIGSEMSDCERVCMAMQLAEQATTMVSRGLYLDLADKFAALAAELIKSAPEEAK